MKYKRHGKGAVYGFNSDIDKGSVISYSAIGDFVNIYKSDVIQSIADRSDIFNSGCVGSKIDVSKVLNSAISRCTLSNTRAVNCNLSNCNITDADLYGVEAEGVTIMADSVIKNCKLSGFTITNPVRIDGGEWTRCPRSYVITHENAKNVVICEGVDGTAFIGCVNKPIERWLKGSRRFAKAIGWNDVEHDAVVNILKGWL
jgi:hypothetical protein